MDDHDDEHDDATGHDDADAVVVDDVPKPAELLALGAVCAALFVRLRDWFAVADDLVVDLRTVTGPTVVDSLRDPQLIAGFAMRKLQALHLLATPGVRTTTDMIVHNIESVLRALVEAPRRHLTATAEDLDWDREWQILDEGMLLVPDGCPEVEANEYRILVTKLFVARDAVIAASTDGICVFS